MKTRRLRGLMIALAISVLLVCCNNGEGNNNLQYNVGDEVVLVNDISIETYDSGCYVPSCINSDTLEDFYWAVKDENSNEIFELHKNGSTVNIDCGTRARIETLYQDKGYKVYILEGQQYGREFWVYYELVK